ncbi:hypothetical protein [Shewanella sp.]
MARYSRAVTWPIGVAAFIVKQHGCQLSRYGSLWLAIGAIAPVYGMDGKD